MAPDAERAAEACDSFRQWLEENRSSWTAPSGIGVEDYNWLMKNVLLFPYTWEQILATGKREWERNVAFLKIEEHMSRHIPMIEPAATEEEYRRRFKEAEEEILQFIRDNEILTIPDYLTFNEPEPYDRPGGLRSFFQQAGDRDPRPLRAHNLPGHRLDSLMRERDERPIRGERRLYFIDGIRAEATATGLEEILLQAGWFRDLPKTREITYILLAKRGARIVSELKMHSNEWTFDEAFESLVTQTPYWMGSDDATAWFDLELYLRQPGYGMGYTMGLVELEALMAERHLQLGKDFNLTEFFDEFLSYGMIPLSLTRWEMMGNDDQIRHMW